MEGRENCAKRPLPTAENALCVGNKGKQLKFEVDKEGEESDDGKGLSVASLVVEIEANLSELKKKVLIKRRDDVAEKMQRNNEMLLKYTSYLNDSAKCWADNSIPEENKLTFRSQKVLCCFTSQGAGGDGNDDSSTVAAAPIIYSSSSGGKAALRPVKLAIQQNVPPYTTWTYLDRNQRMTEDQSVQGRRRIYYDPIGNETLIASDSDEEEIQDEDPKHNFSKGEDYIIWAAVQEHGASELLFEKIALCIQVNCKEVQARYELLLSDVGKQAQCEAYGGGSSSTLVFHTARCKRTSDLGRSAFKGTQTGPVAEPLLETDGHGPICKVVDEEKVEAKDLVAAMDSFDNLFCRRCLVFDCRLHGCSQPLVHPSEKQLLSIQGSDLGAPCGPHCHLLSQCVNWNSSSAVMASKAWDGPSLAEGCDTARVAKRQKTQDDETHWIKEKLGSGDRAVPGIGDLPLSEGQSCKSFDTTGEYLSFDKEENTGTPCYVTAEAPAIIGHRVASQALVKVHPLASRLTSHKRLARSTSRHLRQGGGGTMVQDTCADPSTKKLGEIRQNPPSVDVAGIANKVSSEAGGKIGIGLTGVEVGKDPPKVLSPKRLARSGRKPAAAKLAGVVEPEQLQTHGVMVSRREEEKQVIREEELRDTAARKLARSARRVFTEKIACAIQLQQLQTYVDPVTNLNQKETEPAKEEHFSQSDTCHLALIVPVISSIEGKGFQTLSTEDDKECGECVPVNVRRSMKVGCGKSRNGAELQDDHWAMDPQPLISVERKVSKGEDLTEIRFDNWTPLEKGLYEKGVQIFGKRSCLIASNMLKGCKSCAEVGLYMVAQEAANSQGVEPGLHQLTDSLASAVKWNVAHARTRFYGRRRGSRKLKFTLKSAGQSAIRKWMVNGKDEPCRQYTPCGCLFSCGKQCPCQLSGTCCEKYCGCAKSCKNRFRGCHCVKSQCCSRQCPCFAAERNCDPDVCRNCWIQCGDGQLVGPSQTEDKDSYQCHNMKMLLKQQQRILLGRSDVAGWGAFIKNTVNKHEYLGEYTGELISHREADKRGKIYDRENSSFLFNLNDQFVLDACRKGDKLKFANHSPNPNCYAKVMMVAGDHRVGIFAKERILAGEELFYDYRYEVGSAPAWARRGDGNGHWKKDDSGLSERRSKHAS